MDNLLWEEIAKYHGHKCPGIVIGFKACEAIIGKMNIKPKKDEIVCITENNTCPVDAIKYVFGCDYKKGNLMFENSGDLAFNIFNLNNKESIRVKFIGENKYNTKEEFMSHILSADINDIFVFSSVKYNL